MQALTAALHVIYSRLPLASVSVTKQEPAGAERSSMIEPDRRDAAVQIFDSEDASKDFRTRGEQMGQERPTRMNEEQHRQRSARLKRIHDAIDQKMNKRMDALMDEKMNKRMDALMDEKMNKRMDALMDERMNKRMDALMAKLARESMERRRDRYAQVGIHRAFARDCARYMAGVSC